jgi:hypothetical protein
MRKQNLIKTFMTLCASALFLTGCASISYIGDDYDVTNAKAIQTSEGFYISTYKKASADQNIDMKMGVVQTPIQNVLGVYIEITNNNTINYIAYLKDFDIKLNSRTAEIITPSMYINAYQSDQTGMYASAQALAPTLSNIAKISNNFQPQGEAQNITMANAENTLSGQIRDVVDSISQHSITTAKVISPKEKEYFYIFVKGDEEDCPLTLNYKDLNYTFGVKQTSDSL